MTQFLENVVQDVASKTESKITCEGFGEWRQSASVLCDKQKRPNKEDE